MMVRHTAAGFAVLALAACAAPSQHAGGSAPPRLDGESGQYTLLKSVRPARLTPFTTAAGETVDLGHFRGKVVLLSFWASWCAPCLYEMPLLDRLAREMAGADLAVVPVSIDERGLPAAAAFYRAHGLRDLGIYLDPDQRTAYFDGTNRNDAEFALYGLPISYILDRQGRVMGYITGAVDWQSDAAARLLRHYLAVDDAGAARTSE
ncbi:TlpA disulfide reductase family protein [Oceanibacterium hippocampi]|uniref:Thiol:disulfide interchange protein TlpA n=1 Tax=Oceanibacterium hippocampi TaxID=745714 RepID=A0A1Y5T5K2_9PROT|nr:TlpA disulfide reductase family protein [Oceanibacterium hippocampi]SLN56390.1 Thiol:disulfide interchange protein TlpA [Oceanibacterium hippocampi]